VNTNVQNN